MATKKAPRDGGTRRAPGARSAPEKRPARKRAPEAASAGLAALFDAVRAAPNDDAPRRALAEGLEAAGDPWGEYLRLDCDLRGKLTPTARRDREARHGALKKQLLRALRRDLALGPNDKIRLRRGLVDAIRISRFPQVQPVCTRLRGHPVRTVSIASAQICEPQYYEGEDDLGPDFPRVSRVELAAAPERLAEWLSTTSVENLTYKTGYYFGNPMYALPGWFERLMSGAFVSGLRTITVGGELLGPEELSCLARLSTLSRLDSLRVKAGVESEDVGLSSLLRSQKPADWITELDLSEYEVHSLADPTASAPEFEQATLRPRVLWVPADEPLVRGLAASPVLAAVRRLVLCGDAGGSRWASCVALLRAGGHLPADAEISPPDGP